MMRATNNLICFWIVCPHKFAATLYAPIMSFKLALEVLSCVVRSGRDPKHFWRIAKMINQFLLLLVKCH